MLNNTIKHVVLSCLFVVVLLLSVLFLSPIVAFVCNTICFILIATIFHNTHRKLCDISCKKVDNLKHELARLTTIDKIQIEKNQIKEELVRSTSYNHHLAGVIGGLNHELSPWISGIYIIANRLKDAETNEETKDSLLKIEMASIQTEELLFNLSKSINKLKNFSVFKSNIKDTVSSWIQLVLLERTIKEKISKDNITVDLDSLDFVAAHSPMYLSQVILNLAKNSIDHNAHMLDTLKIKIYGNRHSKCLIYEDNGKGIPADILSKVFNNFGVTTKACDTGEIHGFGLYSCLNYCLSMKATIQAHSTQNSRTQFVIKFERINDENEIDPITTGVFQTKE